MLTMKKILQTFTGVSLNHSFKIISKHSVCAQYFLFSNGFTALSRCSQTSPNVMPNSRCQLGFLGATRGYGSRSRIRTLQSMVLQFEGLVLLGDYSTPFWSDQGSSNWLMYSWLSSFWIIIFIEKTVLLDADLFISWRVACRIICICLSLVLLISALLMQSAQSVPRKGSKSRWLLLSHANNHLVFYLSSITNTNGLDLTR